MVAHAGRHHTRFYIILITLVIGGIFILLLSNNDEGSIDLTTAAIGILTNKSPEADKVVNSNKEAVKNVNKNSNIIDLALNFDKVPGFKQTAKVSNMELRFDDLSKTITVNDDKLEMNNLGDVSLNIEGFVGEFDFSGVGLSLNGKAKRIEINEVALSSPKDISIAFENLNYYFIAMDSIELTTLSLDSGSGKLNVDNKLEYQLQNEEIFIDSYTGKFVVNKRDNSTQSTLNLEGEAAGLGVSGESLNLNLG